MVSQGDPGDEGDIGEPGPPGLTVRHKIDPDKTTCLKDLSSSSFSLCFQGQNGNPGKSGPSGDPVRLLKAISILYLYYNQGVFPHFSGAKDAFTVSLFHQGTKAERGQKGDLGFKGDLVGLICSIDCS